MNKSSRRSWSQDQKRALAEEARRRRRAGDSFKAITKSMGVLEGSLRLWMQQFPERAIQPVEIIEADAGSSAIAVVTPDGYRIEGLCVSAAVQVLERLR